MESSILVVGLGLVVIVWYFGTAINNVLAGAGKVASKEFELLQDEQEVRIAKSYDDLGKRLSNVLENSEHTKGSVKSLIKDMNKHEEE